MSKGGFVPPAGGGGWQPLLPHWGPHPPSSVMRGLWGTPMDAGGGTTGDTARGQDRARRTLGDPASSPSPPAQAHVPSQRCLTKGWSQPCVSTSSAVFHAGTRPSSRSTLGFQPFPPPAPQLCPLPGHREDTARGCNNPGNGQRGHTARGVVWGGAAGLGAMGEGRGTRGGRRLWIQPSRFDPDVLRG